MRVNKVKCEFFKEKIIYRGYDINKDGVYKLVEKVEVVMNALCLNDVVEVRFFFRLINYYYRFLFNLSIVVYFLI